MIHQRPGNAEPIDQGDIVEACPIMDLAHYDLDNFDQFEAVFVSVRLLVLTQTCDFANQKTSKVLAAVVLNANDLVDKGLLKRMIFAVRSAAAAFTAGIFLPESSDHGLPEMIVDLRQLHTVRLDLLNELCRRGSRRAKLQPPYRAHLAQHLSNTYGRIGLPVPYETL